MIIKKKESFSPIIMESEDIKGIKFYPAITAKDGAPNFAMRLFEFSPGGHTPNHTHNWEHEVYIIEGEGHVLEGKKKRKIKKDDFIFVEALEVHQFQAGDKGMSMICIVPNEGQPN